jgi:hypothetical protein
MQLWRNILKMCPHPNFRYRSIYRLWAENDRKEWQRDKDELTSAKKLIEEASKAPKTAVERSYHVEPIPLNDEDGFTGLAFALPEVLQKFGGRIRELTLDSSCMLCALSEHDAY